MDPISLILAALAAGAIAGTKDTAQEGIKDAYETLKRLIKRKLEGTPNADMILVKHQENPDVWKEKLKDILITRAADQDQEVVQTAQNLLTLVHPQQAATGKYNVQITGNVKGFVQGDQADVTMNFDEKSSES